SHDRGRYGVRLRALTGGPKPALGEFQVPEDSPRFQAHVSLCCDRQGWLWAAWDDAGPNWGKDAGYLYPNSLGSRLYESRRIRVRCLAGGKWFEPKPVLEIALERGMEEYNELPQLQEDGQGRMWLAFRHRSARNPRIDGWAAQGRWDVYATACLGENWLDPIELPQSTGRNDMRISSQRDRDGNVYFAYSSDHRGWVPPNMAPRNLSVTVSRLSSSAQPVGPSVGAPKPVPPTKPVHDREPEQVARIRAYKVEAGGKTYRIY